RTEYARTRWAIDELLRWDFSLDADSVAATVYEFWRLRLTTLVYSLKVPKTFPGEWDARDLERVISWLHSPDSDFGPNPGAQRDALLVTALEQALDAITRLAGSDRRKW